MHNKKFLFVCGEQKTGLGWTDDKSTFFFIWIGQRKTVGKKKWHSNNYQEKPKLPDSLTK